MQNNEYKRKYTDVKLVLLTVDKKPVAVLNTGNNNIIYDMKLKKTENDNSTLTFSTIFDNKLINYDSCEMLIQIVGENDYYIIKSIEVNNEDTNTLNVVAYSEEYELKAIGVQYFKVVGKTPEEIFNSIKSNVKVCDEISYYWKGTDITNTYRYLECDDATSVFSALLDMAENFDATVEFSTDSTGKKWVYLRKKPLDTGRMLIKDRDLKSVSIKYTTENLITRQHGFGKSDPITGNPITIMPVNPTGLSYAENYNYFLNKGISLDYIKSTPRCIQEATYTNDLVTDSKTLLQETTDDLAKYAIPIVEGNITAIDLGIKEVTSISECFFYI